MLLFVRSFSLMGITMVSRMQDGTKKRIAFVFIIALLSSAIWFRWQEKHSVTSSDNGNRIPLAVLGDSDSHSYHDPLNQTDRGGEFKNVTLQWTDVIQRLRPDSFNMGEKSTWGTRRIIAEVNRFFGLEANTPPKFDYRFNYALSGMAGSSLLEAWPWQAKWFAARIRSNESLWQKGVVIIRIGTNDIGQMKHLQAYAQSGLTPEVQTRVEMHVRQIADAVKLIRDKNQSVRIVLTGIFDNTVVSHDGLPTYTKFQVLKMRDVLDEFDNGLRSVTRTSHGIAFMNDRQWFQKYWPEDPLTLERSENQLFLGGTVGITNTKGDHPKNVILGDNHAGTVMNALWAGELIQLMNHKFGFQVPPIKKDEIADLVDPTGKLGISKGKGQ